MEGLLASAEAAQHLGQHREALSRLAQVPAFIQADGRLDATLPRLVEGLEAIAAMPAGLHGDDCQAVLSRLEEELALDRVVESVTEIGPRYRWEIVDGGDDGSGASTGQIRVLDARPPDQDGDEARVMSYRLDEASHRLVIEETDRWAEGTFSLPFQRLGPDDESPRRPSNDEIERASATEWASLLPLPPTVEACLQGSTDRCAEAFTTLEASWRTSRPNRAQIALLRELSHLACQTSDDDACIWNAAIRYRSPLGRADRTATVDELAKYCREESEPRACGFLGAFLVDAERLTGGQYYLERGCELGFEDACRAAARLSPPNPGAVAPFCARIVSLTEASEPYASPRARQRASDDCLERFTGFPESEPDAWREVEACVNDAASLEDLIGVCGLRYLD